MNGAMFNKFLEPKEEQKEANEAKTAADIQKIVEEGFAQMKTPEQRIAELEKEVKISEMRITGLEEKLDYVSDLSERLGHMLGDHGICE